MPTKEIDVSKYQRILCILKALKLRGKQNKDQIDQFVSHYFQVDITKIKKILYKDLSDLVMDQEIKELRKNKDGSIINDYDPSIHKNTICEWYLEDKSHSKILGANLLTKQSASIDASKRIIDSIEIEPLNNLFDKDYFYLVFMNQNEPISIKINKDAKKFSILVSRYEDSDQPIEKIESRSNQRIIDLKLQNDFLSKRNHERLCHFSILYKKDDSIEISDHKSKNGTFIKELDSNQFIDKLSFFNYLKSNTKPFEINHSEYFSVINNQTINSRSEINVGTQSFIIYK